MRHFEHSDLCYHSKAPFLCQGDGVLILKSGRGIVAIVVAEYAAPIQAAEAMKVVVPVIEALEG
jgi:hypothetical protein